MNTTRPAPSGASAPAAGPWQAVRDGADTLFCSETGTAALLAGAASAVVLLFWFPPLGSSLWLDETGTAWAIRGTLAETFHRAFQPGQPSVLFSILAWCAVAIGGLHEAALRMPSLIASLAALAGVYLLARRFVSRWRSLLAAGLFAASGPVAFAAADARPYALALMAVVWAVEMLLKWCDTGRLGYGCASVLLTALAVHLHYLSATMLLVYAYALRRPPRVRRPPARDLWFMAALLAALLLPLFPHALHLWRLRQQHSFAPPPDVRQAAMEILPYRLAGAILLALGAASLLYPSLSIRSATLFTPSRLFLLVWYLAPVLALLPVAVLSDAKLFVPRYYIWGAPGLSILIVSALSAVHPLPARRAAGALILLVFCARQIPLGPAAHGGQDWRGALQAARAERARSGASLLLRSGFPEPPLNARATDPANSEPGAGPVAMYPFPGSVFLLPSALHQPDRMRLDEIVSGLLARRAPFVFVSLGKESPAFVWLQGRLSGAAYDILDMGGYDGLTAARCRPRRAPPPPPAARSPRP